MIQPGWRVTGVSVKAQSVAYVERGFNRKGGRKERRKGPDLGGVVIQPAVEKLGERELGGESIQ